MTMSGQERFYVAEEFQNYFRFETTFHVKSQTLIFGE